MQSPWRISENEAAEREDRIIAEYIAVRERLGIVHLPAMSGVVLLKKNCFPPEFLKTLAEIVERRMAPGGARA